MLEMVNPTSGEWDSKLATDPQLKRERNAAKALESEIISPCKTLNKAEKRSSSSMKWIIYCFINFNILVFPSASS